MYYIFIYALIIQRARFFHSPWIYFPPPLGVFITPTENAYLTSIPAPLLPSLQNNAWVQGQVTDLHVAKSVVSAQFPSYWTSHQHLPQLITPSSLVQFLQLACGTPHFLGFSPTHWLLLPRSLLVSLFLPSSEYWRIPGLCLFCLPLAK